MGRLHLLTRCLRPDTLEERASKPGCMAGCWPRRSTLRIKEAAEQLMDETITINTKNGEPYHMHHPEWWGAPRFGSLSVCAPVISCKLADDSEYCQQLDYLLATEPILDRFTLS